MKLVFRKNEEEKTQVLQLVDGQERPFSYSEMVKTLINSEPLATPETSGDFTDEEKKSINSMVNEINQVMHEDVERHKEQAPDGA
jgi:hypothetical protein